MSQKSLCYIVSFQIDKWRPLVVMTKINNLTILRNFVTQIQSTMDWTINSLSIKFQQIFGSTNEWIRNFYVFA